MTKLAAEIDVDSLEELIIDRQKAEIIEFVRHRFNERYIFPIQCLESHERHGFSMMAISCLLIEAFESFYQGLPKTSRGSQNAFIAFFQREPSFKSFEGLEREFYTNIRCGILHQAETTGGWKIRRAGNLVCKEEKVINAALFFNKLEEAFKNYLNDLEFEDWESNRWQNLIAKLKSIIKNCK